MPITALFAGLLAPLYIVLALRVILWRRSARVSLGDGGDPALMRRMRVHANFAEYAPYTLVLMGLAESLRASRWSLAVMGGLLVAGRLLHALGVSRSNEIVVVRIAAMVCTIAAIATAAIACVRLAVAPYL
jgi:uncharacterized membrane protein YecN with MAPEG domain